MNFYVVRHGQTDWNVKEMFQGKTDIPLNETGIKQAEQLKEELKNIKYKKIVSSPLVRAKKTAEIISNKNEVKLDNRIVERGLGDLEGKALKDIREFWNYNTNLKEQNVENIQEFFKRVYAFLDEEKEQNEDILIVTHGGVIMAINAYFNGIPEDGDTKRIKTQNCKLIKYTI